MSEQDNSPRVPNESDPHLTEDRLRCLLSQHAIACWAAEQVDTLAEMLKDVPGDWDTAQRKSLMGYVARRLCNMQGMISMRNHMVTESGRAPAIEPEAFDMDEREHFVTVTCWDGHGRMRQHPLPGDRNFKTPKMTITKLINPSNVEQMCRDEKNRDLYLTMTSGQILGIAANEAARIEKAIDRNSKEANDE